MSSKMGHVGSKTRSLGQISEKPCVCSRDQIFGLILMKLGHSFCPDEIFFLAPLAKSQRAIFMALCPSSVRVSVNSSFQKHFPQKLLTGFLQNFTGMFLRWSSFKFLQIIVFYQEFWLPWQPE